MSEKMNNIKCLVACFINNVNVRGPDTPTLYRTRVVCTDEEKATGAHLKRAKIKAAERGFKPVWVVDETDPAYIPAPDTLRPVADGKMQREILKSEPENHAVVGIIGTISILEELKPSFPEAPFTAAIKNRKTGKWQRTEAYSESASVVFASECFEEGLFGNSQFGKFASKMLELNTLPAEYE